MTRTDILVQFDCHEILPTPQRIEIAEILLAEPQHLSAEQIICRLRKTGSSVSKATVYNTLNLFGERGLVKELCVDPKRRFYDSRTGLHHHFYNVDTGELTDIGDDQIEFNQLPNLPEGTVGESVEVMIKVRSESD